MSKSKRTVAFIGALLLLAACTSRGPVQVEQDRFDYSDYISESWKSQGLMNIVRMRYVDWPVFMEIQQVISAYRWEIFGTVKGEVRTPIENQFNKVDGAITGRYQENPTVIYKPLSGALYSKAMLSPPRPAVLLALIKTGMPADQMFRISVHSINGVTNDYVDGNAFYPAYEPFNRFVQLLRELQLKNALGIEVAKGKHDLEKLNLRFKTEKMNEKELQELASLKDIFGLDKTRDRYRIVFGSSSINNATIALRTRSIIQVLETLSATVEVPPADIESDAVPDWNVSTNEQTYNIYEPIMAIKSGDEAPSDAYAAVKYLDNWFWIADTDARSKRSFQYLSLLLTITESGSTPGGQVVIPTG